MRIGLVISKFDPRRGGAELWTFEFGKRLLARGHEVHVISAVFSEEVCEWPFILHRVEAAYSRVAFAAAAEELLRALSLDVIHDMGMGWHCDVFQPHGGVWRASTEAKMRLLPRWLRPLKRMTIPLLPRYRIFHKLAERQFANPGTIILALSRMVAEDFQRYYSVRPEQIRLVYVGVDTERFSPEGSALYRAAMRERLGVAEGEMLFLFLGNDYQRKGLATAIEATAQLRAQGFSTRLLVVGGKSYRRIFYALQRGKMRNLAIFAGMVNDAAPYYAAADAFVLPTLYDPCSASVLEAAACGLPCITSRLNGAGELLSEGVQGYLLDDPCDASLLTDKMRLLFDEPRRRRLGAAARRLMLEHTLDRNCEEIIAIYEQIVQTEDQQLKAA